MSKLSALLAAALVALFSLAIVGIAMSVSSTSARAQTDPPPNPGEEPQPTIPMIPRDHFTLYPAGPGEIPYEELSDIDRDQVDRGREWAEVEHGEAVHQAWRGVSAWGIAYAEQKRAEREAQLEGADDVGVR